MTTSVLPIRLPKDIDERLTKLAKITHRTKTFYVREAIISHLEDLEDIYYALDRLEKPGKILTSEDVEKKLGLED
jgi:RHH-type rel operon transcriptional repressor/antitoxin RelB